MLSRLRIQASSETGPAHGSGGVEVRSDGDCRLPPRLAAAGEQGLAVGRHGEFEWVGLWLVRVSEMHGEPEESHLEADPGRARPVGVPLIGVVGGVSEGEAGVAGSIVRHINIHPGDEAAELPGDGVLRRGLAGRNAAAGVAFQLIAAAKFEVSADGQEPVWDAVGVG